MRLHHPPDSASTLRSPHTLNIRRSLIFSYLDRYASLGINIASSMAIARLLTPADIGIFSVTMVLLAFVATVRDMGAGNYLVQEKELTVDRIRAVWAVQLGLGLFLAVVVLAASVPVALFYHEPRMQTIMIVISVNYAINPFGSLTYAWQIREMRFDALAIVRFCASVAGAAVSIFFAWRQWGPLSLALGSLASTAVNALLAVYFRPKWFPWLPGLKEIKRVLAYGSQTTGAAMISTIATNIPELLLGKLQNMTVTGLYSRASGLVLMFDRLILTGISSVSVSWFARQSRERGTIAAPFLKATSYLTAIGLAFVFGLVFLAFPAMRILYGTQWDGAVEITRLVALALGASLPATMCVAALMALGGAARVLRGTAITTGCTAILIAAATFGGLRVLGVCLVVASALRSWYWLSVSREDVGYSWRDLGRELRLSAVVGLAAAIGPAGAFFYFGAEPANVWLPVAVGVPFSVAGFVGAIWLTRHPLLDELQAVGKKVALKFS